MAVCCGVKFDMTSVFGAKIRLGAQPASSQCRGNGSNEGVKTSKKQSLMLGVQAQDEDRVRSKLK